MDFLKEVGRAMEVLSRVINSARHIYEATFRSVEELQESSDR